MHPGTVGCSNKKSVLNVQIRAAGVSVLMVVSRVRPSGFGKRLSALAILLAALLAVSSVTGTAAAQSARRTRRESNATRRARIERTIQDTYSHRWEVGGGGGFLRFQPGQYKQRGNEVTYWGSALYSLNPRLGIVGMTGGAFGSARLGNGIPNAANPQIQQYNFLAGPSYRVLAKQKYAVSVYGAGGVGWGRFSTGPHDFPPTTVGLWPSGFNGAFTVGANVDYNFYPNLSVRLTPNYLGTTFGGTIQNSKGINAGLVYRFGRIH